MLDQSLEWKNLSLAFLIDSITSGTSTGGEDRRIVSGEVGVLTLSSIANGIFAPNEHRVVPSDRVGDLKVAVRAGTLIMSRSNTIDLVGTVAYVDKDYPNLFLSDLLWELTVSESSSVLPKWLGYALSTHKIRREIQKRASGTSGSMKKLSRERFRSIHILVPPQPFQEKSCQLIEKFDRAIALTEKLIAAKRRLKKGLMRKLFTGECRFSEFIESQERKTTTIGSLPKDWAIQKFSDVAEIDPESLTDNTDPSHSFKYIDLGSVKEGKIRIPAEEIQFHEAPSRARKIVKNSDILMSTVRTYLNGFARIEDDVETIVCSTGFSVIRASNQVDSLYIYEFLFTYLLAKQVHARLVGSNYPAINSRDVRLLHIPWPSLEERRRIGKVLSDMRLEIQILEQQLELLKRQKRGLMQKLLTGDIQITTLDDAA